MQENNTVFEIDGKDYIIVNKIVEENKVYVMLVNHDNPEDFMIQEDGGDEFLGVDKEMFSRLLPKFLNNIKNLMN